MNNQSSKRARRDVDPPSTPPSGYPAPKECDRTPLVDEVLMEFGVLLLHRISELEETDRELKKQCNLLSKMCELYSDRMVSVKREIKDSYACAKEIFGDGKVPDPQGGSFNDAARQLASKLKRSV